MATKRTSACKNSVITLLTFLVVSIVGTAAADAAAAAQARHGIAMHGIPAYGPDFSHFNYVNPDAPKGGELRLAVLANGYDTFNPFVLRGVAASSLSGYMYDTLMVSSDDEAFSEYGLIAASVETPDDRSYVTFNLRKEARFQDGKPITAEDVKFSFELLTTKGHPFYRSYYADVSKVTVESPLRVRFDFGSTNNRELPLILGQLPILPKHYWADRDFAESGLNPPIGSGPYRIGDFDAGRSITYERVKDYWAADLPSRKGRFNFDRIRIDYYSDDTVALESFKAGNYDFRLETSAKNWATAYTGAPFDNGDIKKEAIAHHRPAGMQAFVLNTRRPQFSDPRVRKALAYAFDFEWANKNLFFDQYTRTDSYFDNSELASSGLPQGKELELLNQFRNRVPATVFNEVYVPPSTTGGSLRENLRQALNLLREAGYEIRDRKMVNTKTGEAFEFEVLLTQKAFERVVLPFKDNLAKLGIDVTVRMVDTNQYIQRVRGFDYDIITQVLPQSDSPGNEQRDYWHSSNVSVNGSRNYMGVQDPVVDELVDLIIQAPDRSTLVTRVHALDRVLLHGYYVIPHWHLAKDRVAYWKTLERPAVTPKNGVDIDNWWTKH